MDRRKIDNALRNEREKYLAYEATHDVSALESAYLQIAKDTPEDLDSQPLVIAMEELGELQQAIAKGIRGKEDVVHLAEELADVSIITDYVKKTWDISEEDIQIIRALKLEQLEGILKRLKSYCRESNRARHTALSMIIYDEFMKYYHIAEDEGAEVAYNHAWLKYGISNKLLGNEAVESDLVWYLSTYARVIERIGRNIMAAMGSLNIDPDESINMLKYNVGHLDIVLWMTATTLEKFGVKFVWREKRPLEKVAFKNHKDVDVVYDSIVTVGKKIDEFVKYLGYSEPVIIENPKTTIIKALNKALIAIEALGNVLELSHEFEISTAAVWLYFKLAICNDDPDFDGGEDNAGRDV